MPGHAGTWHPTGASASVRAVRGEGAACGRRERLFELCWHSIPIASRQIHHRRAARERTPVGARARVQCEVTRRRQRPAFIHLREQCERTHLLRVGREVDLIGRIVEVIDTRLPAVCSVALGRLWRQRADRAAASGVLEPPTRAGSCAHSHRPRRLHPRRSACPSWLRTQSAARLSRSYTSSPTPPQHGEEPQGGQEPGRLASRAASPRLRADASRRQCVHW